MTIGTRALIDFYANDTLGAPDNAVGFVLWRVMHRFQRQIDRALAPLNLTHLQFTTLAMAGWLCRSANPVTQAELARHAEIHPMQVSLMLKALEAKHFVVRPRSVSDSRTREVEITPAGLEALRAAMPVVIDIQQRMFGDSGLSQGALLTALRAVEEIAPSVNC
jgi:DNA-binding MarR family transcriptional regulator